MKTNLLALGFGLSLLVELLASSVSAGEAEVPRGHWEGHIELPNTKLAIQVDLEKTDGAWTGSIDIPVQGVRGMSLDNIEISSENVRFGMSIIPGSPSFEGRVGDDGKTIRGEFTQAGGTYPFVLENKPRQPTRGETPSEGVPGQGFAGVWQGSLKSGFFELRLLLELIEGEGGFSGDIDSVDQNAFDIPLTTVSIEGDELDLELSSIGAAFSGTLSDDGSEVDGTWKQGGQELPLSFKRLEKAPDLRRPQDPVPPYPYNVEDVVFTNEEAGIDLAGTFTYPKSKGPFSVVILLTGSGPQDRDEALMGHRPFLVLADHLTRNGIATLRFDDRGVGKSGGSFESATNWDFVSDAKAALAYVKSRSEIDASKIGLVGHSEGSITASRAAVESKDVAFVVFLAGVGVPMDQLLARQAQDLLRVMGADDETIARQIKLQKKVFNLLREGGADRAAKEKVRKLVNEEVMELTDEQREALGVTAKMIDGQVEMMFSPWFRDLLDYDPRGTLKKLNCPVLALNGELDVQVAFTENLAGIEMAVQEGGNTNVTTIELPGLNHLFQTAPTGAVAEYGQIDETFSPKALEIISDWISER